MQERASFEPAIAHLQRKSVEMEEHGGAHARAFVDGKGLDVGVQDAGSPNPCKDR